MNHRFIGWIGAIILMIAPFYADTRLGLFGLVSGLFLITIQAYGLKAYNIVLCNTVGIFGYMFVLFT